MPSKKQPLSMHWKVHVKNLFDEMLTCNEQNWIFKHPLLLLYGMLQQVAARSAELNDPVLNDLMCRLTMYTIADPEHEDYDLEMVKKIQELAEAFKSPENKKL